MTLTLRIDSKLEKQLLDEAARRGVDPDSYAIAAIAERLDRDRGKAVRSSSESELLQEIATGLPDETWERYDHLVAKRRAGALTEHEYESLQVLTDQIELDHARRLEAVRQLAELRQVGFEVLMHQLGVGARQRGQNG